MSAFDPKRTSVVATPFQDARLTGYDVFLRFEECSATARVH